MRGGGKAGVGSLSEKEEIKEICGTRYEEFPILPLLIGSARRKKRKIGKKTKGARQ